MILVIRGIMKSYRKGQCEKISLFSQKEKKRIEKKAKTRTQATAKIQ